MCCGTVLGVAAFLKSLLYTFFSWCLSSQVCGDFSWHDTLGVPYLCYPPLSYTISPAGCMTLMFCVTILGVPYMCHTPVLHQTNQVCDDVSWHNFPVLHPQRSAVWPWLWESILWRKLLSKTWRPTWPQRIRFAQTVHPWLFSSFFFFFFFKRNQHAVATWIYPCPTNYHHHLNSGCSLRLLFTFA